MGQRSVEERAELYGLEAAAGEQHSGTEARWRRACPTLQDEFRELGGNMSSAEQYTGSGTVEISACLAIRRGIPFE